MTPRELSEMRAVLREDIAGTMASLTATIEALRQACQTNANAIQQLREKDAKYSGTHKAITQELIPALKSKVDSERESDMSRVGTAVERIAHIVSDLGDRFERLEQSTLVQVVEKGKTSLVPAAPLAAKVGLDNAIKTDVIAADTQSAAKDSKKALVWWRHPGFAALIVFLLDVMYQFFRSHV